MLESNALRKLAMTLISALLFLASSSAIESGVTVGKEAPDFKLKPVGGGNPVNLSQLRGKPVVVVYWAAWCGPCRKEIPALKQLYEKYSPKGVQFVSIAVGWRQTEEDVGKFKVAQQLPYQILWDKDNKVAEEWKINSIPTNFVIDLDGVIRYRQFGISSEIETLLQSMVKADN